MKTWVKAFLMFLIFILVTAIWIIGIIFADFKFFILGVIFLCFLAIFIFKNREELKTLRNEDGTIMEDERNMFINEKAGYNSLETIMAIIVFTGVAILTLRDIYPEYLIVAYTLFSLSVIGFIIHRISIIYYKRKYD
ncbi:MAG: DUF2178 domain-containing protein [Methanobrevibacter sp.]|nr:DUF2178 domain-containing protein [Methanobrevibacter sp.]